jgi:hypothetical protein
MGVRWGARWLDMCRRDAFGLTAGVLVPLAALVQLSLEHRGWNAGRMLEYQSAPVQPGREQDGDTAQRRQNNCRPLETAHPFLANQPPEGKHPEDAQSDEGESFVRLHDPVYGLTMGDVILGLQAGDHSRDRSDSANQHQRKSYLSEHQPPSGERKEIEEDSGDQQGNREVVQERVNAGPIVAEHGFSQRRER